MTDSRRIFGEVLKLIKDSVDPDFEDVTCLDHVKVVIDDAPDADLSTG